MAVVFLGNPLRLGAQKPDGHPLQKDGFRWVPFPTHRVRLMFLHAPKSRPDSPDMSRKLKRNGGTCNRWQSHLHTRGTCLAEGFQPCWPSQSCKPQAAYKSWQLLSQTHLGLTAASSSQMRSQASSLAIGAKKAQARSGRWSMDSRQTQKNPDIFRPANFWKCLYYVVAGPFTCG